MNKYGRSDLSATLAALEQAVNSAPAEACPSLIGELERLKALAWGKLVTGTVPANGDDLLTIPEVAQRLKVSAYRAYELARRGLFPSIRLGKSVRVKPSAVAQFLAKQGG